MQKDLECPRLPMNKDMFKNKWLKLDIEEIDKIWKIKIILELLRFSH